MRQEQLWQEKFELLEEFVRETGHLPSQKVVYRGANIGCWLRYQTSLFNSNKLTSVHEAQLRSIGVDFKPTRFQVDNRKWLDNFTIFSDYFSEFGCLPKHREQYKGVQIGVWFLHQKQSYKRNELLPERIAKFRELGVSLETTKEDIVDARWQRKFDLLCEYVSVHGCLPTIRDEYKKIKIGYWLHAQTSKFRRGVLKPEREERLRTAGVLFERTRKNLDKQPSRGCQPQGTSFDNSPGLNHTLVPNALNKRWNDRFNTLIEFVRENGRLPVCNEKYKGFGIGTWFWKQKNKYRNGELAAEHANKMRELVSEFEVSVMQQGCSLSDLIAEAEGSVREKTSGIARKNSVIDRADHGC